MALKKQVTLDSGVTLEEAYIKIRSLECFNHSNYDSYVIINVAIFFNQEARNSHKPEVITFSYKVTGDAFTQYFAFNVIKQEGVHPVSQAYLYLKTLSFYADAEDVLDIKE